MRKLPWLALLTGSLLLAGCENNGASYVIDDSKNHSISLLREQNIAWFGQVEQRFVVSRFPECQRRYTVDPSTNEMQKIDLYSLGGYLYAAQQGKTWYAMTTEDCSLQKLKEAPPPIPANNLVGSFEKQGDNLVFKPAAGKAN